MPIVLYTKVVAQYHKLATVVSLTKLIFTELATVEEKRGCRHYSAFKLCDGHL